MAETLVRMSRNLERNESNPSSAFGDFKLGRYSVWSVAVLQDPGGQTQKNYKLNDL